MLPDIRAIIAVVIVTAGLLAVSFGVVATFRVAQDNRVGSLQADLAQRGRALASSPGLIETPAPLQPAPVASVETQNISEPPPAALAAVPVLILPLDELAPVLIAAVPPEEPAPAVAAAYQESVPPAEPPMGGPLEPVTQTAALPPPSMPSPRAATVKSRIAEKAAAARKARAARLARERRAAAARRAAQARRVQQNATQPSGGFNNNSFGSSFGNNSFGGFGNTTPRTR